MPDRFLTTLATLLPRLVRGGTLHHAGLAALARGDHPAALHLFAAAGACYRRELAVEPLARLRVHELIAEIRGSVHPGGLNEQCLEVERRLARLDSIEALEPPFAIVPARTLLATWFSRERTAEPPAARTGTGHAA